MKLGLRWRQAGAAVAPRETGPPRAHPRRSDRVRPALTRHVSAGLPALARELGASAAQAQLSSAFTESTANQFVSKRIVKRQQMRWTLQDAHLLLQVRTRC
jgi:hypothetical protein